MKKIIILLFSCTILLGCPNQSITTQDSSSEKPRETPSPNTLAPISPEEARCNRETDKIFNQKYPERQGKPIEAGEEELVQEWLVIRNSIEGCKKGVSDIEKASNNSTDFDIEVSPENQPQIEKTDSLISSEQVHQLRAVGVPVIIPTYIPDGFELTNFTADTYTPENNPHADSTGYYDAVYQGTNRCHFGIAGSEASWGDDIDVSQQWVINTKIIGEVTLMHITRGGSSGQPELQAWVFPGSERRIELIKGFPYAAYRFYFICKNTLFSPQEAIKIIEHLEIRDN